MVAIGHTSVGAIVGITTYSLLSDTNTILGLITAGTAGTIFHYIMDTVPHGHFFKHHEYKKKIKYVIIFDFLLSIILFSSLSFYYSDNIFKTIYILFGIGGSQLPDIVDGLIYTGNLPKKGFLKLENSFHQLTHWHGREDNGLLIGLLDIWQILTILFAILLTVSIR